MNGSSDREGIVEVCYQGVWTTASLYSLGYYGVTNFVGNGYNFARVLCRQLGYHDKCEQKSNRLIIYNYKIIIGVVASNININGGISITYYSYSCTGNEPSLQSCRKGEFDLDRDWNFYKVPSIVALECQQSSISHSSKTQHCINSL